MKKLELYFFTVIIYAAFIVPFFISKVAWSNEYQSAIEEMISNVEQAALPSIYQKSDNEDNQRSIVELYVAWFNRIPDQQGVIDWANQLANGMSLASISEQFYLAATNQFSAETGYHALMNDEAFIIKLYEGVMGRVGSLAPDKTEITYWKSKLNQNSSVALSRGELVVQMIKEVKAFDSENNSEIRKIQDTFNNKLHVASTTDFTGSIEEGKLILSQVDETTASINTALASLLASAEEHNNASNIVYIGEYHADGYTSYGFELKNDLVYLANSDGGLKIIDISNSALPILVGEFKSTWAVDVTVKDNLAYLADGLSGLKIIDISNPNKPILLGATRTQDHANQVEVVGDFAYIADNSKGIAIINISNPSNPYMVGSTEDYLVGGGSFYISKNLLYIIDHGNGLKVLDITDPTRPNLQGEVDIDHVFSSNISVKDNFIYAANGSGIKVIDVSNPLLPQIKATISINKAEGIRVIEDLAYIAINYTNNTHEWFLELYDIKDFSNPIYKNQVHLHHISDIKVSNDFLYLSNKNGLTIMKYENMTDTSTNENTIEIGSTTETSTNENTSDTETSIGESTENTQCTTEKKYCADMVSCEEAKHYLNICGLTRLDGNKDGIPCNALCENTSIIENTTNFQCMSEKKYCADMVSCEEAKHYLNICGLTRLDGNKDGIPCNTLCR